MSRSRTSTRRDMDFENVSQTTLVGPPNLPYGSDAALMPRLPPRAVLSAQASQSTLVAQHRRYPPSFSSLEDSEPEDAPQEPVRSRGATLLIMVALCIAVFLAAIDMVIITTALPTIARSLKADDSGYAWIGSAYLLANAAAVPFWGNVSDIFGRKPALIIANAIFMVGSLIATLAKSLGVLVAARAVQGAGGGGLITLVSVCVGDLFSERERGMYFGMVGSVWALSFAIGPVLGGAFAEKASWRWCFGINLPLDGLSLVILVLFLKIQTPKTPLFKGLLSIDWIGALTIIAATVMFLFGLQVGGVTVPWKSATVICLLAFGLVTYIIFAVSQKFAKYPVMPYRIFSSLSNVAVLLVVFFHGLGFIGVSYFLPVYFQIVLHASPVQSGIWFLAGAGPLGICCIGTGIFIKKTGRFLSVIRLSMVILTVSLGLFINFPPDKNWPRIVIFQILVAFGIAPNFQAPLIALQSMLKQTDVAVATSAFGFVRMVASAMSVVIGQVIFQSNLRTHLSAFLVSGIPPDLAAQLSGGNTVIAYDAVPGLDHHQQSVFREAATKSLAKVWLFYTVCSALGLVASLGISQEKELSETHTETKTGLGAEEEQREVGSGDNGVSTDVDLHNPNSIELQSSGVRRRDVEE